MLSEEEGIEQIKFAYAPQILFLTRATTIISGCTYENGIQTFDTANVSCELKNSKQIPLAYRIVDAMVDVL